MMTTHTSFVNGESPSPVMTLPKGSGGVALAQVRSAVTDLAQDGRSAEAIDYALAALAVMLQKSSALELLVAKLRAAGMGKRSERTNAEQLALLLEALLKQAPDAVVDPDAEAREDAALTDEIAQADAASPTPRRARRSWRTSETVARELHVHDVPAAAQVCVTCGRATHGIGHDDRQILAYVPARFVVHEHQLPKYACGYCKDSVTTAAGPSNIVDQRSADASLLAHVVVSNMPTTRRSPDSRASTSAVARRLRTNGLRRSPPCAVPLRRVTVGPRASPVIDQAGFLRRHNGGLTRPYRQR